MRITSWSSFFFRGSFFILLYPHSFLFCCDSL